MIFFRDSHVTLYNADVMDGLAALPSDSIHCVVTSPPYWGLRNYGVDGQLGLEKTPDEYIAKMVAVFREVGRVLRPDGTLWLNMGDSYCSAPAGNFGASKPGDGGGYRENKPKMNYNGLKPKDLCGIPWMLAFALRADGWWLRSDIIWHKKNPMPESILDRPTKAHEYIFLLTKSERYFYDAEAVKEEWTSGRDDMRKHGVRTGKAYIQQGTMMDNSDSGEREVERNEHDFKGGRNLRSVWTMATQPYPESHFATFPEALPTKCILAGTSERGCCPECGAPRVRVVGRKAMVIKRSERTHELGQTRTSGAMVESPETTTIGWRPSCSCGRAETENIPCTVLDPFGGSGTVGAVAKNLNRRATIIELNPKYCEMVVRRISPQGVLL